jgi:pyruvate kinase
MMNTMFRRVASSRRLLASSSNNYSTSPCLFAPLHTKFHLPDPSSQFDDCRTAYAPKLTKIVGTIGPTSEQMPVLQEVVRHGMRIMRLNFSHATVEEVELRTDNLKQCRGRHSIRDPEGGINLRAVLLDTKGPEIRTGKLANDVTGKETIQMTQGSTMTLQTTDERRDAGSTETHLYIDYTNLHKAVQVGMKVLLDDGAVALTVTEIIGNDVVCEIDNSGELRSRAGVNLPGADTSDIPAMSDKDKADIKYGMTKDIDYVAASFVQTSEGVHQIRNHMEQCAQELGMTDSDPRPLLISKIESLSGLANFDAILEASDGIMVARGDLGVELPLQQVTNAQKEMVAACNAVGKPVIVATQMLESMAKSPRPTRAEVADVTNAIYDGADCVMLSGETAKGKYPVESVKMMNEIILSAERYAAEGGVGGSSIRRFESNCDSYDASIAKAAVTAADTQEATAIVVLTQTGSLATLVSAYRPHVPILAFCPTAKIGRQLMIYRGIHPIVGKGNMEDAVQDAQDMGFVKAGDSIVVVSIEDSEMRNATMKLVHVP